MLRGRRMQTNGFQWLVGPLGDLAAMQREPLITVLKRKVPSIEALKLIEMRFAANPTCGHCDSDHVRGWSSTNHMVVVTIGRDIDGAFARECGILHISLIASRDDQWLRRLPLPQRQRPCEPPQRLPALTQGRHDTLSAKPSRLAANDRAQGRNPHRHTLRHRSPASALSMKLEQSQG